MIYSYDIIWLCLTQPDHSTDFMPKDKDMVYLIGRITHWERLWHTAKVHITDIPRQNTDGLSVQMYTVATIVTCIDHGQLSSTYMYT